MRHKPIPADLSLMQPHRAALDQAFTRKKVSRWLLHEVIPLDYWMEIVALLQGSEQPVSLDDLEAAHGIGPGPRRALTRLGLLYGKHGFVALAHANAVQLKTVYAWRTKNYVPARDAAAVADFLTSRGVPTSIEELTGANQGGEHGPADHTEADEGQAADRGL